MTAIVYTAKRRLVTTGFLISAIDISAANSDSSFNSVGLDFLGLLAAQWILVSGSVSNDGWHQLDIDSTAGKITTLSTLVDETAGNLITIEGYYNTIGLDVNLETDAHTLDVSYNNDTRRSVSLSGVTETLFYKEVETWTITTDFLTEEELSFWTQFSSSVAGGESFTIDLYGSIASPDNVQSCILEGAPEVRRVNSTRLYQMTLMIRLL